jgi:hypothetical protein
MTRLTCISCTRGHLQLTNFRIWERNYKQVEYFSYSITFLSSFFLLWHSRPTPASPVTSDLKAQVNFLSENVRAPFSAILVLYATTVCTVKPVLFILIVPPITLLKFQITTFCIRSGFPLCSVSLCHWSSMLATLFPAIIRCTNFVLITDSVWEIDLLF